MTNQQTNRQTDIVVHREVTLPKNTKKILYYIILCDEIMYFLNLQINNMLHGFRFQIIEMKMFEWLIGLYLLHSVDAGMYIFFKS